MRWALGAGNALAENPGGLEFDLRLAGIKNAFIDLILHRLLDGPGRMAQHHRAHAAIIVDQPVAVGIEQIGAFAAGKDQRPARHADAEIAVDPARDMVRGLRDQLRGTVEGEAGLRAGLILG